MAQAALVGMILGVVGELVTGITQSNQLRSQAKARKVARDQELAAQKSLLRKELGKSAVSASASGLLGGSFEQVFTAQAIADANFLGQIKQRADFEIDSLKNAAKGSLISGLFLAGTGAVKSFAGAQQNATQANAASAQRRQLLQANPNSRLKPGRNPFGPNTGRSGTQAQRNIFSQTGF